MFRTPSGEIPDYALDLLCADFDRAILRYRDWMEAKMDEQAIVPDTDAKPGAGQRWGQRYKTLDAIWDVYRRNLGIPTSGQQQHDPIAAKLATDDLFALMDPGLPV
jgi:hypothetical protein